MDGPAFHRAAELLELCKKRDSYYSFQLKSNLTPYDQCLSEMANLTALIMKSWSQRQRTIIRLYTECEKQEIVANKLDITQQAVSDALRSAYWRQVMEAHNLINTLLDKSDIGLLD